MLSSLMSGEFQVLLLMCVIMNDLIMNLYVLLLVLFGRVDCVRKFIFLTKCFGDGLAWIMMFSVTLL